MKALISVLITLLIAATCFGQDFENVYLMVWTNSPATEFPHADSLDGYTIEFPVEHFPPLPPYDEMNQGDHNLNTAWTAQVAFQPDRFVYGAGCNEPYWERTLFIEGKKVTGTFHNFKEELKTIARQKNHFQENHPKNGHESRPVYYPMKESDLLVIVLAQCTGLNPQGLFLYYFNSDEMAPDSSQTVRCEVSECHGVSPIEIMEAVLPIQGGGHVLIVSAAWSSATMQTYWTGWQNFTHIACADVGEPYYHVNGQSACGDNEIVCMWQGRNLQEFYLGETWWHILPGLRWIIGHECPYGLDWNYHLTRIDGNGNNLLNLFETCYSSTCNDQNTVRCYGDNIFYNVYCPDEEELGGGRSPVIPDIYPNPFNPTARIAVTLEHRAHLKIAVYNILGQQVAMLCNANRPAGFYDFNFYGAHLPTGIYLVRTVVDGQSQVKKMILQK